MWRSLLTTPSFGENLLLSLFSLSVQIRNAGQCCSAGSRTYVADELFDEFARLSVDLAKRKVLGDPTKAETTMGPVINASQKRDILRIVAEAKKSPRVKVLYEGPVPRAGFYVGLVVIEAPHDSHIAREEIFGPVQVLVRLPKNASDAQILHLANDSNYGLAGAYFGETGRCIRLARKTESGIVWCNDFNVCNASFRFSE
jgi:acyl-CoA reductase-like NAD-dependent aldehyde dehydrogenase